MHLWQDKGRVLERRKNWLSHKIEDNVFAFQKEDNVFSWDKSKCSKGIKSRRKREQHMERQGSIEAHGTLRALFRKQK